MLEIMNGKELQKVTSYLNVYIHPKDKQEINFEIGFA